MSGRLFDEIDYWSEVKVQILREYAHPYGKILTRFKTSYIDGFAGPGASVTKATEEMVDGSPIAALRVDPPFGEYHFVELDPKRAQELRGRAERICLERGIDRSRVHVHEGDSNQVLRRILPTVKFNEYRRALCLLDPYGLNLDWSIIQLAGEMRTIDLVLNFPTMDINRNAIWKNPERLPKWAVERMSAFWGDESWRAEAYRPSKQLNLLDVSEHVRRDNEEVAEVFRERLRSSAGFRCVPEPIAMRNRSNAVVYYLFFASQEQVAAKIARSIFRKWENHMASG